MLPNTTDGRGLFLAAREVHNRWRAWDLERSGGDMDSHGQEQRAYLARIAEVPSFREVADYCASEGLLNADQLEAVNRLLACATDLQARLGGVQ